ncbi:MAG: N-acetylmuramoyl-L-alanine amidase [Alphaproteobacteria bacterium]|nr:N-acetylmuramoyl-L-alanine amidase [Alphaproteobacteria bacterium]
MSVSGPGGGLIVRERRSPNHDSRAEVVAGIPRIDMLVLHYTGMQSAAAALDRLCDPEAKVSAHYLVEEDGAVWRLVSEERRAWHAGASFWMGESTLNSVSIGVEIVNPGHEWGYRTFPEPQMLAVETLCSDIVARRRIPSYRVVGHSDIAPTRKTDPGELFDWPRLARAGIGLWPEPAAEARRRRGRAVGIVERARALADLARIGYQVEPGNEVPPLVAFQRRFRPERWDGKLDGETAHRLGVVRQAVEAAQAADEVRRRNRFRDYRRLN